MRSDVKKDWTWSDAYLPAAKCALAESLIQEASLKRDTTEATDLIVLNARDIRIACRIRRSKYYPQYADEFTIRYHRDNGYKTEWSKIVDGWGDWMFYGFADAYEPGELAQWTIFDLSAFRATLIRDGLSSIETGEKHNGDGTYFRWVKVSSLPKSCIVAADWITHPLRMSSTVR